MDGYIRVSRVSGREGESFISPAEQRKKIEGWAELRDVEILDWPKDLDQSGNKRTRPELDKTLARIAAGETDGIVVAKLDRLSRLGTSDALKLVGEIVEAGGSFAAIDLGIDPTTPSGEMMLTLMLALAHMQWRELGEGWQTAKSHAVARGLKIGIAPIGYEKGEDGRLRKSPDSSNIAEAFRLAGSSGVSATMAFLSARYPGRVWTPSTTRRLLSSHTYLGQVTYGDLVNDTAHEPLVTRAEWEAAQHPGQRRKAASMSYPLSGIAVCAGCGRPMVGSKSNEARVYRCKYGQALDGGDKCSEPAVISASRLEPFVREALKRVWVERAYEVTDTPPGGAADAQAALEDAEAELYAFAQDTTLRKALGSGYQELLAARVAAVEEAKEAFRIHAQGAARERRVLPQELIDTDDPELLRDLLSAAFEKIEIIRGRGTVSDRTRLYLYGSDIPVPTPQVG